MNTRQLMETLRRLSKVFGYTCNVIISAPALLFHPFEFLLIRNCVYRRPLSTYACPLIQPQASETLITTITTAWWKYAKHAAHERDSWYHDRSWPRLEPCTDFCARKSSIKILLHLTYIYTHTASSLRLVGLHSHQLELANNDNDALSGVVTNSRESARH